MPRIVQIGLWIVVLAASDFVSVLALAQTPSQTSRTATQVTTPTVTQAGCQALARRKPVPSATYQPGIDVHGNKVAPADLPGNFSYNLPDKIEFDIAYNPLAGAAINAAQSGQFNNTALKVGHVVIDTKTGEATLNGQKMQSGDAAYIDDACRKAGNFTR